MPVPLVQAGGARRPRRDAVDVVVSFGGGSCADLGKAVCFFTEQEAGTPGAVVDRPSRAAARLDPHHLLGRRAHAVLRDDRSGDAAEDGRRRPDDRPDRRHLRPRAHAVDPATGERRDGHERAGPLRRGRRTRRTARPRPRRSRWPAPAGSSPRCRWWSTTRATSSVRASMLEGAVLGGRCLQNASMGVHHGLAQLVGGRTGIPHGLANAVILPHAMRFNAEAVPDEVRRLGEAIGRPDDPAGALAALVARLGLPARLGECGVTLGRPRRRRPPVAGAPQHPGQPPPRQRGRRPRRSSPPRTSPLPFVRC